ncbi:hypothetical protein [Pseudonocardia sp. T1-2H]|uniref:hypothetical protein n=1 Tax=Pseudonocardia sp. T1-2H TaxID=3128899 RepID=UPI003101255B
MTFPDPPTPLPHEPAPDTLGVSLTYGPEGAASSTWVTCLHCAARYPAHQPGSCGTRTADATRAWRDAILRAG